MSEQQLDAFAANEDLQQLLSELDQLSPALRADVFNRLPAMLQSLIALFESELKGVVKNPEHHAQRLVVQLATYLGGIQTYIPRNDRLKTMLRNIKIYNRHSKGGLGSCINDLAVHYNLTAVQIYNIIREQSNAEKIRRQLNLF